MSDDRRLTPMSIAVSESLAEKLRLEAAKRGLSRSTLVFLLLKEKTNGFTNFDVRGYDVRNFDNESDSSTD